MSGALFIGSKDGLQVDAEPLRVALRIFFFELLDERLQFRVCRLQADAPLQLDPRQPGPRNWRGYVVPKQAARKIDIAGSGGVIKCESAWHYANNDVVFVIELQVLTDYVLIAVVVALPKLVVQYCYVGLMRSLRSV